MAYEVTTYGHNAAMEKMISPSMESLLNTIEIDPEYIPTGSQEKLLRVAEEKGLIMVI